MNQGVLLRETLFMLVTAACFNCTIVAVWKTTVTVLMLSAREARSSIGVVCKDRSILKNNLHLFISVFLSRGEQGGLPKSPFPPCNFFFCPYLYNY